MLPLKTSVEPARSLRISIMEGSFCAIHVAIASSVLVTGYALMLGADEFHLGLLTAFSSLGTIGSLVGAELVGFLKRRKIISMCSNITGRGLWGFLCLLPFLPLIPREKLYIFLGIVFVSTTFVHIATNSWLSWMNDLVPEDRRGRYFAYRNTILGVVTMVTMYVSGFAFDKLKALYGERIGFSIIFGVAAFAVVISGSIIYFQWEPTLEGEKPLAIRRLFSIPFANESLRKLLIFTFLWNFAIGIALPFWAPYMIKNLEMSYATMSAYWVVSGIFALMMQPFWGHMVDRFGSKALLTFCVSGITFLPLLWLFSSHEFYAPIWIDAFFTGILWPGFNLAAFTLLLETIPGENRAACLAVNAMTTGLALFTASIASGVLAKKIQGLEWTIGSVQVMSLHLIFLLSALTRFVLWPFVWRLKNSRTFSAMDLLFYMVGSPKWFKRTANIAK